MGDCGIECEDAIPLREQVGSVFQQIGGDSGGWEGGKRGRRCARIPRASSGGFAGEDIDRILGGGEVGFCWGNEGAGCIELTFLLEKVDA